MSIPPYSVRLREVLPLSGEFEALFTSLDDILTQIGLTGSNLVINPPVVPAGDVTVESPLGETAALELLEYFEGEEEVIPPPPVDTSSVIAAVALNQGSRVLTLELKALRDIAIELPGLEGVSLIINPGGFQAVLTLGVDEFSLGVTVSAGLRFAPDILRPLRRVTAEDGRVSFETDTSRPYVQIELASVSVTVDSTGSFDVSGGIGVQLDEPVMIGKTGVVIESADIVLSLSGTGPRPAGTPSGWKGLLINNASLRIPSVFSGPFTATGLGIGSGGVSGTIGGGPFLLNYNPTSEPRFTGDLVGSVFGISGGLSEFSLTFQQNIPAGGSISAKLALPFFETDEPLDLDIGLTADGTFTVAVHSDDGLLSLHKPGLFDLQVESVGFEADPSGLFKILLSGEVRPDFGGFDWPTFKVNELSIDSEGNVRLEGGWLDLPDQYSLDFHGFQIDITKLGFGKTEDGDGKWIGFSGGLKLVDGFSAGASVEGLRLSWYDDGDIKISLEGVGVEFEVPEVLRFKGEVSYRELPGDIHRFDGDITLDLIALDMQIDAQLVIGTAGTGAARYTFFAIYLGVELPAGIPLGATGLALFGMAGLFALEMQPDKHADEEWFENADGGAGWYLRPDEGVSDLSTKWAPSKGSLALGAGVTLGTLSDNGFTFNGKLLLVIVFPGPILLIEGRANLLKERAELDENALFRALAVLDGSEGTLLLNLAAEYKYGSGGELIEIRGSAEAFFDFSDADAWHLYLGENEPREKRIRAEIFQLFEANAYFMLDARQLAMGAWVGYDKHWKFGPLSVTVEAWIEGNVVLSWKPVYLHGDLWLHGTAGLKVFGFGLTLGVDARFAADVFDPFHLLASFTVSIGLPWPLSDIEKTIELEWGPEGNVPPLPMPLKEIAVEHFKSTTSWPLPRPSLLKPAYDGDGDGFVNEGSVTAAALAALEVAPPLADAPVVPLDSRPHLTFGRAVHDKPLVGTNANFVVPARERIGDPAKNEGPLEVEYSLRKIELHKFESGGWSLLARRSDVEAAVGDLYGSWAPVAGTSGQGVAQTKLWLWSKSAFDYTRHSGSAWNEWFTDQLDDYPCVPPPPDREICCDFEAVDPENVLRSPYYCSAHEKLVISWLYPPQLTVTVLDPRINGFTHALCFPLSAVGREGTTKPNKVVIGFPEPAKSVRILIAEKGGEGEAVETCVDFKGREPSQGPNSRTEQEVEFEVLDRNGRPSPQTRIDKWHGDSGLNCGYALEINLPCASSYVDLTLSHASRPVTVVAFNGDGIFADQAQMTNVRSTPQMIRLTGRGVTRLRLTAPDTEALLHSVCFRCGDDSTAEQSQVTATGFTSTGQTVGPVAPDGDVIELLGDALTSVVLRGKVCILQVCINIGPDPTQVELQQEMAQHLIDEMARWSQQGDVLEPHTDYRIKVVTHISASGIASKEIDLTEFGYFRTEGPPGLTALSTPVGIDAATFDSGLQDLVRYVGQTVPASVPAPGEKPLLPRPVYRAYDVGVKFNENYVDLMYRIAGRDLGLYLYDNNNRPVRDVQGRLIVLSNRWGVTEDLTLTESENYWVTTVNGSDCAEIDTALIPHSNTLAAADDGQVLAADTLHEGRLVPLLLHEAFADYESGDMAVGTGAKLGVWTVADEGTNAAPSHWEVGEEGDPPSRYVIQISNIWGGTIAANDPVKPGTVLFYGDTPSLPPAHPEQPSNWTDYRLSVYMRAEDDDAIGVAFRYADAGHHYRFVMDRERKYRRLLKIYDGATTILAEDEYTYILDRDYLITVEAIGASLRLYQDGQLVFEATDQSMGEGTVGLYCWANTGARFSDVHVDDFSLAAPVVYRFKFTTSRFTNFFHHLHSYQDETWRTMLIDDAAIASAIALATSPSTPLSEGEARAYEVLAQRAGLTVLPNPKEVQVTRLELDDDVGGNPVPLAFLIRCSEPVDWARTTFELSRAARAGMPVETPRDVKLTDVTLSASLPNEESVTILLRESVDLSDYRVEYKTFPAPLSSLGSGDVLFADEFEDPAAGLLFKEDFGPNALDHYTIVDEGTYSAPSSWSVGGGRIVQSSNIYGGNTSATSPDKPGTTALVNGSEKWTDVRVRTAFNSGDDDAIGIVFRYADADNYYRISFDRQRGYRRLVKRVGGILSVLWQDAGTYNTGQSYNLVVDVFGDRLIAHLDNVMLFNVRDADLAVGQVGFYCWANAPSRFEALEVEALRSDLVLGEYAFTDLSDVDVVDEGGAIGGPSLWAGAGGVLTQTSDLNAPAAGVHFPGTYAHAGEPRWRDVQISARLRSDDDDAIGLMFRYVDGDNYYRFSMDSQLGYRRLVKNVAGVVTTLWQDAVTFNVGQSYDLTIRAVGSELRAYLDASPLFTVYDGDLKEGRIAFYCWGNTGARFERALVTDAARRVGGWLVTDEGTAGRPSVWGMGGSALLQKSAIGSDIAQVYPGTYALGGDAAWTDYRLTAEMRSDNSGAIGVLFRYVDADNYYRLSLDHQHNVRRLIKKEGGVVTLLWEEVGGYTVGVNFTLTVEVAGSRLIGYAGTEQLFDLTDAAHTSGQVGLYCWANTGARFERIEVRKPNAEAYALLQDRFGIGETTGWSFVDEGALSAPSAWGTFEGALRQTSEIFDPPIDTATLSKRGTQAVAGDAAWADVVFTARLESFDDDAIGVIFRYLDADNYYRFSMDAQRSYRRLVKCTAGSFTLLWEDDYAYEVGHSYELTFTLVGGSVRGCMDGVPFLAVEDVDVTAGLIGLYTWGNVDTRFSYVRVFPATMAFDNWMLDEAFDSLDGSAWTFVDEGTAEGPSDWQLSGGSLRQTSNIHDADLSGGAPEKSGTYALGGDPAWNDYRVIVRLASFDDEAIGVMFRYVDADNYYRFSMDSQRGYRRLVKKLGGIVSVLWEDNVSYEVGRDYLLVVDCVGERLTGYLDGLALFALDDVDLPLGQIGLYCWGNEDARFAEVQIAAPVWAPYYSFSGEEVLPAGTRVQVLAGNESDVTDPGDEAGLVRRFVATLSDHGTFRLSPTGNALRLVAPDGETVHARGFLPGSDYTIVNDAGILRKADGTAFILTIPTVNAPGSKILQGEYRMRFTYRRDNQTGDLNSLVFSQAGITSPEVVTLDVPWSILGTQP